jgi:hypothetical protein
MRARIFAGILLLSLVTYAVVSAVHIRAFSPAADLPRGAMVYLQFEDLPGFIKLWNQSSFKEKYLQSQNFESLSQRHLGLKIASRWQEFSDAIGMPIDTDVLSSLADKRAAVAVYDIGKLDVVFIAPMKAETFEATRLMQNSDKFDDEQLDDGTHIYRVNIDADRGRQKQQVLFAHVKGRLIVATSEKLLAETVSIITGRLRKSALSDDPAFSTLAGRATPKTLAVWVDQTALNSDYYFKRYWLISDVGSLKNIRSGMFDLSIDDRGISEEREFLLNEPVAAAAVSPSDASRLMSRVPDDAPYYKIRRSSADAMKESLVSVLSLEAEAVSSRKSGRYSNIDYDDDDDYSSDTFDQYIDETDDDATTVTTKDDTAIDFSAGVRSADPRAVLTVTRSRAERAPLFVEFDKAAVVTLASPAALDRSTFERSLSDALSARLLVRGQKLDAQWVTKTGSGLSWRELEARVLGWGIEYSVQGNQLIIANGPEFLTEILSTHEKISEGTEAEFSELTVVRPIQVRDDLQSTFERLAGKDDLFTGNMLSLFDSVSAIDKIEVSRSQQGRIIRERLRLTLKTATSQNQKAGVVSAGYFYRN